MKILELMHAIATLRRGQLHNYLLAHHRSDMCALLTPLSIQHVCRHVKTGGTRFHAKTAHPVYTVLLLVPACRRIPCNKHIVKIPILFHCGAIAASDIATVLLLYIATVSRCQKISSPHMYR